MAISYVVWVNHILFPAPRHDKNVIDNIHTDMT